MRVERFSDLIIQQLDNMVQDSDSKKLILTKRKAISALFPYAIFLERCGDRTMADAVLRVAKASCSRRVVWYRIWPYAATLFSDPIPPSLNRLITLFSPYVRWDLEPDSERLVSRWAAATLAIPYTEEVGQSVVDALLQIAYFYHLRPHISRDLWALLTKRPLLPPYCPGRNWGTSGDVVRHIRGLGDPEILKSYLLLVWSEWSFPFPSGRQEMLVSIREDFGQVGTRHHREDLVGRLDHILEELSRGLEHFEQEGTDVFLPITAGNPLLFAWIHVRVARNSYEKLREELREGGGATNTCLSPNLTRQERALTFFCAFFTVLNRLSFALLTEIFPFKLFTQQMGDSVLSQRVGTQF